ncbi:MAG TPA: hypothetical protein VMU16_09320 [Candidatus Binataceae bacterium]|nr:hypothetical protein [Candidatus Binataceae bacterium]
MEIIAKLVSLASGFALAGHHLPPATTIMTSLAIDVALAPLTAAVAVRRGRSVIGWTVGGLMFGAWALGVVIILRPNRANAPQSGGFPPTDAAA